MNDEQNKLLLLEEENQRLRKECASLNGQVKRISEKLEEAESFKSHFIANITNELINPFTSIMGLSKTILSVKKEQWKKVISMVALIHSEAFDLDFQFRNLFYAAKLEAGEVSVESLKIDIPDFLQNIKDAFRYYSKKKKLSIEINVPHIGNCQGLAFKTDPEKLKLILSNLLKNAINFSYEEQKIELTAWIEEQHLKISVRDHGRGISSEDQKYIFDRFRRLNNNINSINKGQGLGLSLTMALLEVLNGNIDVVSEPEKGAVFTITVPETEAEIVGFSGDGDEMIFGSEDEMF